VRNLLKEAVNNAMGQTGRVDMRASKGPLIAVPRSQVEITMKLLAPLLSLGLLAACSANQTPKATSLVPQAEQFMASVEKRRVPAA
jgi:hypothetical protein